MTDPSLTATRDTLVHRLTDGWQRIDQAVATGADVTAWESFWIELLHEYEAVCSELSAPPVVCHPVAADPPLFTISGVKSLMNLIAEHQGMPEQFDAAGNAIRQRSGGNGG